MTKMRSSLLTQPHQGQQLIAALLVQCAHSNTPLHIPLSAQVNNQLFKCHSTAQSKGGVLNGFIVYAQPNQYIVYGVCLHVTPLGVGVISSVALCNVQSEVPKIVCFWNAILAIFCLPKGATHD